MLRILEIGQYAAGYAGRLFVQAGAEVVRIESDVRAPAWASDAAMDVYLHAGKKRVSLTQHMSALAERADVVICEAPCADAIDSLDFDSWSTTVKVAITPFGRTGPKRNWHATPNVLYAMGGYTQILGDPDRAPLNLPGHYLEFQSGALGFTSAMACVYAEQSNAIDIGMYEVLMSLSQFTTVRWHCAGEIRTRHGSDFHFVTPSELFRCADGWVYVNIVPAFWDPFTVFLDRPELLVDERFSDNDKRMQHRVALHEVIADAVKQVTSVELEQRAHDCRVPVGVVQTLDEVLTHPHLAARNFWQTIRDTQNQSWQAPGPAYRFSDEPLDVLQVNEVG